MSISQELRTVWPHRPIWEVRRRVADARSHFVISGDVHYTTVSLTTIVVEMGSKDVLQPYTQPEFKYTTSPNTGFKYGQKADATEQGKQWLEGEKAGWTHLDPDKMQPG